MKTLLCGISFLFLLQAGMNAQGHDQTLIFTNLGNKTGTLYIGWYDSENYFRKADKAILQSKVEVKGELSVPVVFEHVAPGTYAVAVFFDENGNGKMDTNFFGIPKEKYGFSNNVHPMMRAASFKESAFTVTDKDQRITIRLR